MVRKACQRAATQGQSFDPKTAPVFAPATGRNRARTRLAAVFGRGHTNVPDVRDICHREVREARRGDPAGLLRRYASRNDSLFIKGRWYRPDSARAPQKKRPAC